MQHTILQVMKCMMAIKGIGPSAITVQWPSGATTQSATTPMIAFDPSGGTTQPADQNASSTQLATGYVFLYYIALSLASGSSIDWFYCSFLLIVMSLLISSLLSSPAGLLAPADLYSSADHDASPMTSSSMVHLDVPAGSLLMFQLVHLPLLALAAGSYRSNWFTMLQLVQLGLRLITNN
ncbi:hypothetical protein F511_37856 [Dorcoceras hygrometricum]|uniref:Uncharacterized protein n=1 Tax=Dorcoceras hygrometricum TaxID=472368 RepID=A0A2Z7CPS5_9LAMI|nr:hypothetical protein F511_37856 [Dorcoceras hygrometricum]